MLDYTLNRTLVFRAVIERDMSGADAYGADTAPDWQEHATVPCALWWDMPSTSGFTHNQTYVSPARTVPASNGGMIVPAGTDVTEKDRISRVLSYDPEAASWVTYAEGLFTINSVLNQGVCVELGIVRAHLGA